METKISGVYKITNNITGDCYIGSSRHVKHRWSVHKCPSTWKKCPNSLLYLDMQKYGLENFTFKIVEETSQLKEREQYFIDLLQPSYNNYRASGQDVERYRDCRKEYQKTDKGKESHRKASRKCGSKLCLYEGETLTLVALSERFRRQGILHPTQNAKEYLLRK